MSETLQPLTVRDFIGKYVNNQSFFDELPEFSFIKPVASKVKAQNCFCGLNDELNRTIMIYNEFVNDLTAETVSKVGSLFGHEKVCFSIQTQNSFSVKCY